MALNLGPLNVLLNLKGAKKFEDDAQKVTGSMSSIVGGIKRLGAAYVTLEGAKKALDLSQEAASFADAAAIFRHSGGNLDALRDAVRGTVSDFELVKKANLAKTMGIPSEAMGTLAQAAIAASKATGESVDFMLDSIVRGVARGSPLILDNLGIIISIEEANAAYAKTLGKTASELTKAEQAQAVLGATLKAVGPQIENANKAGADSAQIYAQFTAAVQNLTLAFGQSLSPAISWITKQLVQAIEFYQELFSIGDTSDSAEQAMDAIATKTKAVSVELAEAKNQYAALARAIREGTAGDQFRLMGIEGDPERKLAQIGNEIMALEAKMAKLGHQARGVGVSGIGAPMAPLPQLMPSGVSGGAAITQAASAVEATVTSRLVGVMDIGADMMQGEFDDLMNSFGLANDVIIEHADELALAAEAAAEVAAAHTRFAEQTKATTQDVYDMGRTLSSGVTGYSLGSAIAPALGSAVGMMVGGPMGGAIGSVLGETFGPLFDVITRTLKAFEPLIDIINQLAVGVFIPLVVAGGPVLEILVDKLQRYVVPALTFLGDALGWVQWGVTNFQIALDNIRIFIENMFRSDDQKLAQREFISVQEQINAVEEARRRAMEALNGETDATTEKFRELNEELSNVPIGVKRLRLLQYGATRGSVAFPGRFAGASAW